MMMRRQNAGQQHAGNYAAMRRVGAVVLGGLVLLVDGASGRGIRAQPASLPAIGAPMPLPAEEAKKPAVESFDAFVSRARLEATRRGISADVLARAFDGLQPDLTLPDLVRANRPAQALSGQAEFSKTPLAYLNPPYLLKLATEGRRLAQVHAATLARVEREIGVDRHVLLAIWGRETAFGKAVLGHDIMRVLATQAWTGRRRQMFEAELFAALALMQQGILDPRVHKASWAGALGLVQFMPSEFATLAVDFDGDGRADLWRSVPDALASAARQLKAKGWSLGQPWGLEVVLPASITCESEGPAHAKPASAWLSRGVSLAPGARLPPDHAEDQAFLLAPGGAHGPAFLVFENFMVLKRYNLADLYAVFVGHLADRIAGRGAFLRAWTTPKLISNLEIAEVQGRLKARGAPIDRIDGRAGMVTRSSIGAYQRAAGLQVDCWAGADLLAHLKRRP